MRFMLVGLLALGGCAAAAGEGQTYAPGILGFNTPLTDAANVGDGKWLVSCYSALSACTWRSNQVCPTGFLVTNSMSAQESDGRVNADGGGFNTYTKYTLSISCKD